MAHFRCPCCGHEDEFVYEPKRHECPRCGSSDVVFAISTGELPDEFIEALLLQSLSTTLKRTRTDVRLWILSDTHLELTRGWDLPSPAERPAFDVMIVAGDAPPMLEDDRAAETAAMTFSSKKKPLVPIGSSADIRSIS